MQSYSGVILRVSELWWTGDTQCFVCSREWCNGIRQSHTESLGMVVQLYTLETILRVSEGWCRKQACTTASFTIMYITTHLSLRLLASGSVEMTWFSKDTSGSRWGRTSRIQSFAPGAHLKEGSTVRHCLRTRVKAGVCPGQNTCHQNSSN